MSDYRVRFSATSNGPLADEAGARVESALRTMPGIADVADVVADRAADQVSATFWIDVRLGMADAARDGSRLAKEALKVAGMGDAQLTELSVSMHDRPAGSGDPGRSS